MFPTPSAPDVALFPEGDDDSEEVPPPSPSSLFPSPFSLSESTRVDHPSPTFYTSPLPWPYPSLSVEADSHGPPPLSFLEEPRLDDVFLSQLPPLATPYRPTRFPAGQRGAEGSKTRRVPSWHCGLTKTSSSAVRLTRRARSSMSTYQNPSPGFPNSGGGSNLLMTSSRQRWLCRWRPWKSRKSNRAEDSIGAPVVYGLVGCLSMTAAMDFKMNLNAAAFVCLIISCLAWMSLRWKSRAISFSALTITFIALSLLFFGIDVGRSDPTTSTSFLYVSETGYSETTKMSLKRLPILHVVYISIFAAVLFLWFLYRISLYDKQRRSAVKTITSECHVQPSSSLWYWIPRGCLPSFEDLLAVSLGFMFLTAVTSIIVHIVPSCGLLLVSAIFGILFLLVESTTTTTVHTSVGLLCAIFAFAALVAVCSVNGETQKIEHPAVIPSSSIPSSFIRGEVPLGGLSLNATRNLRTNETRKEDAINLPNQQEYWGSTSHTHYVRLSILFSSSTTLTLLILHAAATRWDQTKMSTPTASKSTTPCSLHWWAGRSGSRSSYDPREDDLRRSGKPSAVEAHHPAAVSPHFGLAADSWLSLPSRDEGIQREREEEKREAADLRQQPKPPDLFFPEGQSPADGILLTPYFEPVLEPLYSEATSVMQTNSSDEDDNFPLSPSFCTPLRRTIPTLIGTMRREMLSPTVPPTGLSFDRLPPYTLPSKPPENLPMTPFMEYIKKKREEEELEGIHPSRLQKKEKFGRMEDSRSIPIVSPVTFGEEDVDDGSEGNIKQTEGEEHHELSHISTSTLEENSPPRTNHRSEARFPRGASPLASLGGGASSSFSPYVEVATPPLFSLDSVLQSMHRTLQ